MTSTNEAGAETAPGTQRDPARPIVERPRLRTREPGERRTTWLELFFDLVFVVAVDEVARHVAGPITPASVRDYLVLVVPVWWAWVGYVYYTNRFGTDDLGDRLLTLLQMGATLALAAAAEHALEAKGSTVFALAYGAFRAVLALRYAAAGRFADDGRPLARRFALGFGVAAALWLASSLVPAPGRYALWAAGCAADFATPFVFRRWNAALALDGNHLQERFGNFTLIVLGTGTLATAGALRDALESAAALATAGLALLVAFELWWIYFETSDGAPAEALGEGRRAAYTAWVYAHLPLAAGLAASGISVGHLVRAASEPTLPAPARWLFSGSVALCLVALAIINFAYASSGGGRWSRPQTRWALIAAASVLGSAGVGGGLSSTGVAGVTAAACALPVVLDLRRRAQVRSGGRRPEMEAPPSRA